MSHTVIIKALQFVATDERGCDVTHDIFTLLTTQRQLFNSLAPILTGQGELIPRHPVCFFRLLMRADTFRFATSLYVGHHMTTEFVQEILSKMDCVVSVDLEFAHVDDKLTPTLLALPHLARVILGYDVHMTYSGTLGPLLKHPRESVRRSVAASVDSCFDELSVEQLITAFRDDIIPLIDSASCNGAVVDYLCTTDLPLGHLIKLPRDIIVMLGDRLFQFFTAANSHRELIDKSLDLLSNLALASIRRKGEDPTVFELVVDVFKEWPVLELLPDMLRSGVLMPDGASVRSVIRNVLQVSDQSDNAHKLIRHHSQRCFELHIPDLVYDAYVTRTGKSPLQRGAMRLEFAGIASVHPVSLLARTHVFQREMHHFLIPWHHEVMAKTLRLQRRGERVIGEYGQILINFDEDEAYQQSIGARLVINSVLSPLLLSRREPNELSQVLHLLFNEDRLNMGPILRTFVTVDRTTALNDVDEFVEVCRHVVPFELRSCIERRRRVREGGEDVNSIRCYLAEFLESLDAMS